MGQASHSLLLFLYLWHNFLWVAVLMLWSLWFLNTKNDSIFCVWTAKRPMKANFPIWFSLHGLPKRQAFPSKVNETWVEMIDEWFTCFILIASTSRQDRSKRNQIALLRFLLFNPQRHISLFQTKILRSNLTLSTDLFFLILFQNLQNPNLWDASNFVKQTLPVTFLMVNILLRYKMLW